MAELNFNVDQSAPEEEIGPVPAGTYIAAIVESDYKANKNNNGMILKLTYQILQGEYKGRKIFENLNLEHENRQASVIARKSLNSIGMAVGVNQIRDSALLHNIPMQIEVGFVPAKDGYDAQNKIKKHSSLNGSEAKSPAAQVAPATGETSVNTGANKKPWEK